MKNRSIVGEICPHLGGIPLAIELAAARVTVLPVAALAKALDDRFGVLVGGERTAPPRQQTMRAAIDWSYELLTDRSSGCSSASRLRRRLHDRCGERRLPRRGIAADDVLPLISSLVSKSLVLADARRKRAALSTARAVPRVCSRKAESSRRGSAVAQRHLLAYIEDCRALRLARPVLRSITDILMKESETGVRRYMGTNQTQ